jgi:hypothetical protein
LDYSLAVALSDPPSVLGDRGSEVTTVRHLIEAVGSPVLHVLAAPLGLDHRVRNTVLYDPIDPLPDEPDALLLMSGLRPDEPAAIELVRSRFPGGTWIRCCFPYSVHKVSLSHPQRVLVGNSSH